MQTEFRMTDAEVKQAITEYFALRGITDLSPQKDVTLIASANYGYGDRPTGTYTIEATVRVSITPESFIKKTS